MTRTEQLNEMPDPIPLILAGRGWALVRTAAILAAALAASLALLARFPFPSGWLYHALIWMLASIMATGAYIRSLGRRPPVTSLVDLLFHVAWSGAKALIVLNLAWAVYSHFEGTPWRQWIADFAFRLTQARWLLEAPTVSHPQWPAVNLFQIALLLPWLSPIVDSWRALRRAGDFGRQLAPRAEQRIAAAIARASALIESGRRPEADGLLNEAAAELNRLMGRAADRGLIYHRRLLRERIESLRGRPVSAEFLADPFGEKTAARGARGIGGARDAVAMAPAPDGGAETAGAPEGEGGYGQYRDFLESLRVKTPVAWDEVAGLDGVVGEIKSAFAMAMAAAPQGVTLEPSRRFLLYGPPGTGKTLLTAAVSGNFGVPFYNVRIGDVMSKYFGESTRLLSAIFSLAAESAPGVLFFDEIEAISASRDRGGMDGEERRMLSALLAELDGLKGKGARAPVFVIAATNVPWQIDAAILSRFDKRFYVPLPTEEGRRRILELHLTRRGFKVEAPFEQIVRATRGYSGRELSQLCQEAVRTMMAEANPKLTAMADLGPQALAEYKIKVAPIRTEHLNAAFRKIRPKTDERMVERYEQWNEGM